MAFAPIPEYEGKSPYVFITYAQQDEKIAYSIAVKMYNEGFRLWSSAACGNPSNMRIAERLSNSYVAMVFLSRSYLKYASYKEFEPRAVMNSPKQKIVICLDDTPLGTDWNTVDFPAGIRYNPDIPQELWLRINSSDALEKCRGAWPRNPLPLPFEETRTVNLSVDEDELSDELTNLNSVMSSFGAGLDDSEIRSISLFSRDKPDSNAFRWPEKQERTQEQEYYAIENLIDNAPPPATAEKKQYDNMIGIIESFMQKSNQVKEEELRRKLAEAKEEPKPTPPPSYQSTYSDFRPVPKNEFDRVDLSKDISSSPVVITESSDVSTEMKPIVIDYGDDSELSSYSMTRSTLRPGRVTNAVMEPIDDTPANVEVTPPVPITVSEAAPAPVSQATFEKIVDDRKFITSTEDNADQARLTYHLGALDNFDETDYLPEEPKKPAPKPQAAAPVRFTDDDIPQPTLRFEKPQNLAPSTPPPEEPKDRRSIVSVRTRVRRTEYESEMYEVNGRWIPGEIYHRLMPNAKYTMVRRISRPKQTAVSRPAPKPAPAPSFYRTAKPNLNTDSRLYGAVNTFFTPPRQAAPQAEAIPETVRSALRERHEARRNEAIRQLEEEAAEPTVNSTRSIYKSNPAPSEEENTPARKHKFSHEGGIKKSLMANMETPVDTTDAEESHRQYGARAELAASGEGKASDQKTEQSAGKDKEKNAKKDKEKQKEAERAAKKAAQKEAEKEKRKEAQKKAAQKKAEEEKKKKKKSAKLSKEEEKEKPVSPVRPRFERPVTASQRGRRGTSADVDDDSLIELPRRNLPNLNYDPEAYRDMNLSEILFGQSSDAKDGKKKKKK